MPSHLFVNRFRNVAILIQFASVFSPCNGAEPAKDRWQDMDDTKLSLSIAAQLPGEEPAEVAAKVLFAGKYAVSAVLDPEAQNELQWNHVLLFDLEKMAWYDTSKRLWVDRESCQAWEKAGIELARKSLAGSSNSELSAFVEAMIDPKFQVQKTDDGTITISNSHLTYTISPTKDASPHLLERFLAYDVLNAYNKAMTERKLPPTAQVTVDEILAQEKVIPQRLTGRIKTPAGTVEMTVETTAETFDDSDHELVRTALSALPKE